MLRIKWHIHQEHGILKGKKKLKKHLFQTVAPKSVNAPSKYRMHAWIYSMYDFKLAVTSTHVFFFFFFLTLCQKALKSNLKEPKRTRAVEMHTHEREIAVKSLPTWDLTYCKPYPTLRIDLTLWRVSTALHKHFNHALCTCAHVFMQTGSVRSFQPCLYKNIKYAGTSHSFSKWDQLKMLLICLFVFVSSCIIGCILLGVFLVLLLVTLCLCNRIRLAIQLIAEASKWEFVWNLYWKWSF